MKQNILKLLFIFGTFIVTNGAYAGIVKGFIDGVSGEFGSYLIGGWACETGLTQAIRVSVYAGDPDTANSTALATNVLANVNSAPGVASQCGTTASNYRFLVPLTNQQVRDHEGKGIHIKGHSISDSSGDSDLKIGQSGLHSIPMAPASVIKGHLDNVQEINGVQTIRGWACQQYMTAPITVNLYAGYDEVSKEFLGAYAAKDHSESDVDDRCKVVGDFRFNYPLTVQQLIDHQGKSIYAYGVSSIGGQEESLPGSSTVLMPASASLSIASPQANTDIDLYGNLIVTANASGNFESLGLMISGASTALPLTLNSNTGLYEGSFPQNGGMPGNADIWLVATNTGNPDITSQPVNVNFVINNPDVAFQTPSNGDVLILDSSYDFVVAKEQGTAPIYDVHVYYQSRNPGNPEIYEMTGVKENPDGSFETSMNVTGGSEGEFNVWATYRYGPSGPEYEQLSLNGVSTGIIVTTVNPITKTAEISQPVDNSFISFGSTQTVEAYLSQHNSETPIRVELWIKHASMTDYDLIMIPSITMQNTQEGRYILEAPIHFTGGVWNTKTVAYYDEGGTAVPYHSNNEINFSIDGSVSIDNLVNQDGLTLSETGEAEFSIRASTLHDNHSIESVRISYAATGTQNWIELSSTAQADASSSTLLNLSAAMAPNVYDFKAEVFYTDGNGVAGDNDIVTQINVMSSTTRAVQLLSPTDATNYTYGDILTAKAKVTGSETPTKVELLFVSEYHNWGESVLATFTDSQTTAGEYDANALAVLSGGLDLRARATYTDSNGVESHEYSDPPISVSIAGSVAFTLESQAPQQSLTLASDGVSYEFVQYLFADTPTGLNDSINRIAIDYAVSGQTPTVWMPLSDAVYQDFLYYKTNNAIFPGFYDFRATVSYNNTTDTATTTITGIEVFSPTQSQAEVNGFIDGVSFDGNSHFITGWACQLQHVQSIDVRLFVNEIPDVGTPIRTVTANMDSETQVADQCQSTGSHYRFSIELSEQDLNQYGGQTIYIDGVSITSAPNKALDRSGDFSVPLPSSASGVVGVDQGFVQRYGQQILSGWACQKGDIDSVDVQVYVGGDSTTGTLIRNMPADKQSSADVMAQCETNSTNYGFELAFTPDELQAYQSQAIYVYAISPLTQEAVLLNQTGQYNVPVPAPVGATTFNGQIDNIIQDGQGYYVFGWACEIGRDVSVHVSLYAGDEPTPSTYVKTVLATETSTSTVGGLCQSPSLNHRFKIRLSEEDLINHMGNPVHVLVLASGTSNDWTLRNSGNFIIPVQDLNLSQLLQANDGTENVVIPAGRTVIIDQTAEFGLMRIEGELKCPDDNGEYEILTEGILVEGANAKLSCGSTASPFAGKISFTLKGHTELSAISMMAGHMMGGKGIVAHMGGEISLHGLPGRQGFVHLDQHANDGDTSIVVDQVVNWQAGDEMVIASTGFDPHEAEKVIVSSIENNNGKSTVHFQGQPLDFKHWGLIQKYDNGKSGDDRQEWELDERAEVINLTRNIKVMSVADDIYSLSVDTPKGAHMMIMGDESKAFIDNVEFFRVGRMAEMGRYPFHWHRKGDVNGQFIKNSSIHESYNRCVTVHDTDNALVDGNSCYDHYGHGYFLEDGSERFNTIVNNIGLSSRKVPNGKQLLISDNTSDDPGRFAAPATFWISNPDNTVEDNVSAGSEGTGFWMAFMKEVECERCNGGNGETLYPLTTKTLAFNRNVAHSNIVGITHDGAPGPLFTADEDPSNDNPNNPNDRVIIAASYAPSNNNAVGDYPTFKDLVAYKSSRAGFYYRGNRAVYDNAILADNSWSAFFAFDQELIDTLIVGRSDNYPDSDVEFHFDDTRNQNRYVDVYGKTRLRSWKEKPAGVVVYDGPFYLENVHFAGFSETRIAYGASNIDVTPTPFRIIGASMRYENKVRKLTFNPANPYRRVDFELNVGIGAAWSDSYATILKDEDGTLLGNTQGDGLRSRLIVPNHEMNDADGCHAAISPTGASWSDLLICYHQVTHLRFWQLAPVKVTAHQDFKVTRIDENGGTAFAEKLNQHFYNKFPLIVNHGYRYHVTDFVRHHLDSNGGLLASNDFRIELASRSAEDITPIVSIDFDDNAFARSCTILGASDAAAPGADGIPLDNETIMSNLETAADSVYAVMEEGNKAIFYFKLKTRNTDFTVRPGVANGETLYPMYCSP